MTASLSHPPGTRRGDAVPANGYGRCYGCHLPWYAADEPISVTFASAGTGRGSGQFAMGRGCWHMSTIDQRVEAHHWVCDQWALMQRHDGEYTDGMSLATVRQRLEAAIRANDIERRWAS